MTDQVVYLYGIVGADMSLEGAPLGVESTAVELEREGGLGALISWLPAVEYDRARIEPLVGDVAWVGGRAVAHDGVVTWASERGGVIPVPMFTLYSDTARLRAMLGERQGDLALTLAHVARGEEYGVRVFRLDDVLTRHLGEMSPDLARLEAQAQLASPGQRYLLERKAEVKRTAELRRVGSDVARETFDSLAPHALESTREAVPRYDSEPVGGAAVLNSFYLVRRGALEPFRRSLATLAGRYEPRGFRFEFTGPWPPYHFVKERE
ncbi:MAG: GvpL/GvpF family gas vesicle protein [Gemmatimonadota bacterium]|nr:GvpL/GvpF family gas vesicle protein [Gemmatimonadota bacterium]